MSSSRCLHVVLNLRLRRKRYVYAYSSIHLAPRIVLWTYLIRATGLEQALRIGPVACPKLCLAAHYSHVKFRA